MNYKTDGNESLRDLITSRLGKRILSKLSCEFLVGSGIAFINGHWNNSENQKLLSVVKIFDRTDVFFSE